jgi:HEAT repeat protein
MAKKKQIRNFDQVVDHLTDNSRRLPPDDLYEFSDLDPNEVAALEAAWPQVNLERRQALIDDLSEIGEANYEVDFQAVYRLAMDDEDAGVRSKAIVNLWESEDPTLVGPLLAALEHDPTAEVRAAAASTLGRYVYLSEVEDIPEKYGRRVEDALLKAVRTSPDLEVRRRALEAIAFSSRTEIPPLIEQAYRAPDLFMRVSAVFAMGRSADERWADIVINELTSSDAEVRFEAVRAAGELELRGAVNTLIGLAQDSDLQVREAAIWSLGQIGGPTARETLESLVAASDDDDEREFIEEALENAAFNDEITDFALLNFDGLGDLDPDDLDPSKGLNDRLN